MKKIRTAQVDRYRPGGGGDHRNVAMMAGLIVFGVCFGLSVVGFIAYQGMLHSDFFQITSINIDGCRRIAKKKVLDLSGVTVHANLLSLDLDEMQKRLEAEDWIAQVTIKRQWPNCLEILVKERKPVALVNLDTGLHFVDRDGVIFAAALPPDEIDFPVISGVKKDVDPESDEHKALLSAIKFVGYAGGGNPILPGQNISELYVDADGGLVLLLADRPFPIYLGKERLKTKYYRLARVLHWLYNHKKFETTGTVWMDYRHDKVLVATEATG